MIVERIKFEPVSWDKELSKFPERTIFQTSAWLKFVSDTQGAEPVVAIIRDGTASLGCFAGLIIRKFGFRILGSPFPGWTTSYMGMCLLNNTPKHRALKALIRFAFEDLRCIHVELMDRNLTLADGNGLPLEHRLVPGFEIDLEQNEETLMGQMSSACRRCIRKAEKVGLSMEQAHDENFADEYYSQLKDVFAKQALVPPYGVERVRQLIRAIEPSGMLLLLRARDAAGRCIGTGIFPGFNQSMYFWGGASWRSDQHLRPNEPIQWFAMRYWKERSVARYDMGGGGEYKRKYGGSEIAIPWFRASKYNSISNLRNLAHRFVKTQRRIVGAWHASGTQTRKSI